MTRKEFNNHLLIAAIVFVIGGTIQTLIFCHDCEDRTEIIRIFIYSGALWVVLTKGSQFSVYLGDQIIDWLTNPLLRLFISIILISIMTTLGFMAVYFIGIPILWEISLEETWESFDINDVSGPLIVTLGINLFMHGRAFLLSWKQYAINLEKVKRDQLASQFESLKSQINPHFLFNSLNALSSLVYDDQKKAVSFIRKLSDVYRYVLDQNEKEVVPLSEELKFVESYIYLQKIRFGENLNVNIKIDERSMDKVVPPLSVQLLVENAIKHNIVSSLRPLTIDIVNEGVLSLLIKNNLQEKKSKESTGIGLKNLQKRYDILSDREVYIRKTKDFFTARIPLLEIE